MRIRGDYCVYAPPIFSLPSPPLPVLAVHDLQWYAIFTSQVTPKHTQLVQEMSTMAAYRKVRGGWSGVMRGRGLCVCCVMGRRGKAKGSYMYSCFIFSYTAEQPTAHITPDPSTAPFYLPLQSPKRLREQEDTSSPWHRCCPTPLHLVEGMSLRLFSDHMGRRLSFHLSFMSCVEQLHTLSAK